MPQAKRPRKSAGRLVDDDSGSEDSPRRKKAAAADKRIALAKYSKLLGDEVAVSLTGARAGDVLVGRTGRAAFGAKLEIVEGRVLAWGGGRDLLGKPRIVDAIGSSYHVPPVRASQLYDDIKWDALPNHEPIGKQCPCRVLGGKEVLAACSCEPSCTFRLLDAGPLLGLAAEGCAERLEQMMRDKEVVNWRQVLALLGKHTLSLRRSLFTVSRGPQKVDRPVGDFVDLTFGAPGRSHLLHMPLGGCDLTVRMPSDAPGLTSEQTYDLAVEVVRAEGVTVTEEESAVCRFTVGRLALGAIKSCHQKVVRFGPQRVSLPDSAGGHREVPAELFAAMCNAAAFVHPGVFVPEVQAFTRGSTAALKRTLVTLLEDARSDTDLLPKLAAGALFTREMPASAVPRQLVRATMLATVRGLAWSSVVDWRWCRAAQQRGAKAGCTVPAPKLPMSTSQQEDMRLTAKLLRACKSLPGDYVMADGMAWCAQHCGSLPIKTTPHPRPRVMPLCHGFDHHAYRGLGHVLRRSAGGGFGPLFKSVFFGCTGVNRRLEPSPLAGFEDRPNVRAVRLAQHYVLGFALDRPRTTLPAVAETAVRYQPDAGVLAAAVGPIHVPAGRRRLVVTLGVADPGSEVVMLRASRETTDLYNGVTDKERAKAIEQVRRTPHLLRSPVPIGKAAAYSDGEWKVDGVPWMETVAKGIEVRVPVHPAPRPWMGLDDDDAVAEAAAAVGTGVTEGAESEVARLCGLVDTPVVRRAAALIQQEYSAVAMPTPALDGGRGSDQLAAYDSDPDVWRFLAALSRVVPGALRCEQAPKFTVPSAVLLRQLEVWLRRAMDGSATDAGATKARWKHLQVPESKLMQHQIDAVDDMMSRDENGAPGHFLVMDTGYGKTLTSLCYVRRYLERTSSDVRSVLWVCPVELVRPTMEQLQKQWKAPVVELPASGVPEPGFINCVKHDRLRVVVNQLVLHAPYMVCVFDEVDTMYATTLRTSAAHSVAALAAKVVCQTATPLRSTKNEQLANWLSRVERFPIDARTWLVGANGIVSKQIDLAISVDHTTVPVPLSDGVRAAHLARAGGWLAVARLTQSATDAAVVDEAVKRQETGVLLVANDAEHVDRLVALTTERGVRAGTFAERADPDVRVVVVTKRKCRGYNEATRLGSLVTGVYAGNGADRHQMLGRLRRLGQKRSKVEKVTVLMEHTILHALHTRQQSVDTLNITLEQLAEKYGHEVLRDLERM